MKSYTLVFVTLAAVLFCTVHIGAVELCPQENCVDPSKCDEPVKSDTHSSLCFTQGTSCCSIVKEEFRTHCRHHSGECMDACPSLLTRNAVDCSNNEVCCVLV